MNVWEADIKYYENYLYDKGLVVGAHYNIKDGKIEPVPFDMPKEVQESLKKTLESAKPELAAEITTWASLLNQPLLDIKHAAIDIEVWSLENRIPDPKFAEQPVVAISIVSRTSKTIYLLKRENLEFSMSGHEVSLRDGQPVSVGIAQFNRRAICAACCRRREPRALVAAGSGEMFPERPRRAGVYRPVAVWYLAMMSAGTRPRFLMSMPCSLAQVRTAVVSVALAARLRWGARLEVPPALRAWSMYFPSAVCSSLVCSALRSIS